MASFRSCIPLNFLLLAAVLIIHPQRVDARYICSPDCDYVNNTLVGNATATINLPTDKTCACYSELTQLNGYIDGQFNPSLTRIEFPGLGVIRAPTSRAINLWATKLVNVSFPVLYEIIGQQYAGGIQLRDNYYLNNISFPQLKTISLDTLSSYEALNIFNNANLKFIEIPRLSSIYTGKGKTVISLQKNPLLESFSLPSLESITRGKQAQFRSLYVMTNAALKTLSFPRLQVIEGGGNGMLIQGNAKLAEINFPELEKVNVTSGSGSGWTIGIYLNPDLLTFSFPKLKEIHSAAFGVSFNTNVNLTSIEMPMLEIINLTRSSSYTTALQLQENMKLETALFPKLHTVSDPNGYSLFVEKNYKITQLNLCSLIWIVGRVAVSGIAYGKCSGVRPGVLPAVCTSTLCPTTPSPPTTLPPSTTTMSTTTIMSSTTTTMATTATMSSGSTTAIITTGSIPPPATTLTTTTGVIATTTTYTPMETSTTTSGASTTSTPAPTGTLSTTLSPAGTTTTVPLTGAPSSTATSVMTTNTPPVGSTTTPIMSTTSSPTSSVPTSSTTTGTAISSSSTQMSTVTSPVSTTASTLVTTTAAGSSTDLPTATTLPSTTTVGVSTTAQALSTTTSTVSHTTTAAVTTATIASTTAGTLPAAVTTSTVSPNTPTSTASGSSSPTPSGLASSTTTIPTASMATSVPSSSSLPTSTTGRNNNKSGAAGKDSESGATPSSGGLSSAAIGGIAAVAVVVLIGILAGVAFALKPAGKAGAAAAGSLEGANSGSPALLQQDPRLNPYDVELSDSKPPSAPPADAV